MTGVWEARNVTIASLASNGTVYSNAGVLTNTDPSDEILKNNILTLEDGTLDKLLGLRPVSFNWKSTGDGALGFIAQEVEELANSLGYDFSGVEVPENEESMYRLRYAEFVVPIVKAMQEQQELITVLTKRIEELESR